MERLERIPFFCTMFAYPSTYRPQRETITEGLRGRLVGGAQQQARASRFSQRSGLRIPFDYEGAG
jgi:hypothetical protein